MVSLSFYSFLFVLIFCGQVDDLPRITARTKGQGLDVLQVAEGDTNQTTMLFHFGQVLGQRSEFGTVITVDVALSYDHVLG